MVTILGGCIEGKKFSTGKRCMWIHIFGRQIDDFKALSFRTVTGWGGWCFGPRRHRLCSLVSVSVGWSCTCSFASWVCLRIFCSAIWAREASGCVVSTKHSRVSLYRSLHLVMPRKLNTLLLVILDLGTRILDQVFCFLYCGLRKPSIGYFGHIQGQAHVRLFQLYMTSLPGNCTKHVEYLQEISSCFKQWKAAITWKIYALVAASKMIKAGFVHSWGCLSWNLSAKMPELSKSWCLFLQTVRINALVNHGGFSLRAVDTWSCSFWRTPAEWYTINWRLYTLVWIYSHPTACCF